MVLVPIWFVIPVLVLIVFGAWKLVRLLFLR
jgi:Sec-independent protein translocase protein TatA